MPAPQAQARDIEAAERELAQSLRLDRGVVLLLTHDGEAHRRLQVCVRQTSRLYEPILIGSFSNVHDPQMWFRELLAKSLGSADLFAAGRPVLGWDFFGRVRELRQLEAHLQSGRPVGLYGVRKVGKTSVVLALRQKLAADSRQASAAATVVPVHLDLLGVSFSEVGRAGLLRYLLKSIVEAMSLVDLSPSDLGLPADLGAWSALARLSSSKVERRCTDALERLCEWSQTSTPAGRVVVFVDEYERALGGDGGIAPKAGTEVFDYLRGLVQRYPKSFNFLVAGLSGRLASRPTIAGRQNPLFDFLVPMSLSGLDRTDTARMLRKIGRRLSLSFHDPESVDTIHTETGGHPFLAREYGRILDRSVPQSDRTGQRPFVIQGSFVRDKRAEFQQVVEPTMEELRRAVSELSPDAPEALAYVHGLPDEADAALEGIEPRVIRMLEGFGIIDRPGGSGARVRIGCFGDWLVHAYGAPAVSVAHG